MFVEEFCGSWMDHPFWRSNFVVKDHEQLQRIRESGIGEVWIDSDKGLDIDADKAKSQNRADADARIERALCKVAADAASPPTRSELVGSELQKASRIFRDSRHAVANMFGEARMGGVRSVKEAGEVVQRIADSVSRHSTAMIGLARLKSANDYTFMHSMAVSALMIALARTLEFDEKDIPIAGMAGLLHDMGKAEIPLSVLNKPGNLDPAEWNTMRGHPERGHAMLCSTEGVSPEVLDAVLHHHEKVDGSGYPHGLTSEKISQLAKMCAVCDVYDAVTSDRVYKPGWQPTVAIRKMTEWADDHFDSLIFKAFVRTVGIYPIGSLVRLKSQRLAVVVDHDPSHLLQPTVKAFFSLRSKMHIEPILVSLDKSGIGDRIISYEDPAVHGLTHTDSIWVPS